MKTKLSNKIHYNMGSIDVLTTPAPSDGISGNANTIAIINEYVNIIDIDKEYTLKEYRSIFTDVYKAKTGTSKKTNKSTKKKSSDDDSSDDEPKKRTYKKKDENKPKKQPSAYNLFIRERMLVLKEKQPDAKLRMAEAASGWKTLSAEEKLSYKPKEEDLE